MAAPKGNQFWEARSSHGRNPKFGSPEELWNACVEYFQWTEDNPLIETKGFAFQGVVTMEEFPRMRAMTISGLCIFLGIAKSTWFEYAKKKDFSNITTQVEEIIYQQKFAGAAADLLNPNIIARDLGLKDVKSTEHIAPPQDGDQLPDNRKLARAVLQLIHKSNQPDENEPKVVEHQEE